MFIRRCIDELVIRTLLVLKNVGFGSYIIDTIVCTETRLYWISNDNYFRRYYVFVECEFAP